MKTIAVFYKLRGREGGFKPSKVAKVICTRTTESQHMKIQREYENNQYANNPNYSKALSFCWWLNDADADRILDSVLEEQSRIHGQEYVRDIWEMPY